MSLYFNFQKIFKGKRFLYLFNNLTVTKARMQMNKKSYQTFVFNFIFELHLNFNNIHSYLTISIVKVLK